EGTEERSQGDGEVAPDGRGRAHGATASQCTTQMGKSKAVVCRNADSSRGAEKQDRGRKPGLFSQVARSRPEGRQAFFARGINRKKRMHFRKLQQRLDPRRYAAEAQGAAFRGERAVGID